MLAIVSRNVNESVICACPQRSCVYRGLSQREYGVVIFDRSDVVRQRTAAWLLFGFVVPGEVAANLRPALSVIGRFENALRRCVHHIWIMRRKHQRRNPLKTMRQIDGAMTGVIDWHRTDILYFLFGFVVAVDEAFVVRIDDVPVARIRHDEPTFTAPSLKPVLPANHS